MNALAAATMTATIARASIPPRLADLTGRRDRLVATLLGYRLAAWDDEVDPATERCRARERVRAVQNVKARRRRRKLGVTGGRRTP